MTFLRTEFTLPQQRPLSLKPSITSQKPPQSPRPTSPHQPFIMAQFFQPQQQQQQQQGYPSNPAQNLQFYPSSYSTTGGVVSGHSTPSQAYGGDSTYGSGAHSASSYEAGVFNGGGGGGTIPGGGGGGGGMVSGRMGEQGGLRTGWLAAFGTEGYDGEPPLLEELGVNFRHIKVKVCLCLVWLYGWSSGLTRSC